MGQTFEAVIDANGQIRLLGDVQFAGPRRALVTVFDEAQADPGETALLAEAALGDWNRSEEDAAWSPYFES